MNKIGTPKQRLGAEMALLYILSDMLETQKVIVSELAPRCGFELRHELKRAVATMTKGAKDFRQWTRRESNEQQLMIGACSDAFLQFLRLVVDRTEEDADMYKIYNMVKNGIPSKRCWPLADTERRAFEDILDH